MDNEELSELAERLCLIADEIDELEALIVKANSEINSGNPSGQNSYTRADVDALVSLLRSVLLIFHD